MPPGFHQAGTCPLDLTWQGHVPWITPGRDTPPGFHLAGTCPLDLTWQGHAPWIPPGRDMPLGSHLAGTCPRITLGRDYVPWMSPRSHQAGTMPPGSHLDLELHPAQLRGGDFLTQTPLLHHLHHLGGRQGAGQCVCIQIYVCTPCHCSYTHVCMYTLPLLIHACPSPPLPTPNAQPNAPPYTYSPPLPTTSGMPLQRDSWLM